MFAIPAALDATITTALTSLFEGITGDILAAAVIVLGSVGTIFGLNLIIRWAMKKYREGVKG